MLLVWWHVLSSTNEHDGRAGDSGEEVRQQLAVVAAVVKDNMKVFDRTRTWSGSAKQSTNCQEDVRTVIRSWACRGRSGRR